MLWKGRAMGSLQVYSTFMMAILVSKQQARVLALLTAEHWFTRIHMINIDRTCTLLLYLIVLTTAHIRLIFYMLSVER